MNTTKPGVKLLSFQWYESDSEAIFALGSHLKQLKFKQSSFGDFEIAEHSLDQKGITLKPITMPHGGLSAFSV
jgi:hypothetical protein